MPDSFLEEYALDLHQEVLARTGGTDEAGDARQLLREEVFTEIVLELLTEQNEIAGCQLCSYESRSIGRTPAAKLNAWAMSDDGVTLDLVVTLYHGTGHVAIVGKPEMRRQFELVSGFLQRALGGFHTRMEESSPAFPAMQWIHEARKPLATVRLFVLTDGVARTLDIEQVALPGMKLEYVAWDLEKLSRLRVGERQVIELDLAQDYGGGIPCLRSSDGDGEYQTYLAFFPAPLLARIYGEHGQRLLERNVRAFLQTKGKVNRGLQATLREEPHRFLAYNNGLCCTAAEVRLAPYPNGAPVLTWIRDFQIVNGGQTTASVYHAWRVEKLDLSEVTVQVKLTVIREPDQVAEIVPLISRYANSQNRVNGADFAANGTFHRRIEELSRTVWAPATSGMERGSHWYYERARGSYLDDKARQGTPARRRDWARQNPPAQKFTKTDLAKHEHAWLGLPHLVCRGAEKNFEAFAARLEDDGEPVVDRTFFEHVVARTILWRSTEKLFDALKYRGYRANSVAYAVAWLAERSERRLDLDRIWREQSLTPTVAQVLSEACAAAHGYLTGLPGNVGEASKKPETWAAFRDLDLDVDANWRNDLHETPTVAYPPRQANGQAQAERDQVTSVSAQSWFALAKWAKDRGLLESWQRSLAFSLGKLVARGAAPSDKQAVQGARILARARELGFITQPATENALDAPTAADAPG